jgi:hypothetical protein
MDKILIPDEKSTIPNTYRPETIMITIRRIEKNRGMWSLSSDFTTGYITKANKKAIVKGKITLAAIFSTAPVMMQQTKTIKEKTARPE